MSAGNIPITGTITTTNEADTYPTHWDKYAKGGFRSVANIEARDAISLERRTVGMQIFINDTKQLQQLVGGTGNANWVTLLTLDSNNNVQINFSFTGDGIIKYDSQDHQLKIATPDVDYATSGQLELLVDKASKFADNADSSAGAASKFATTASGAAAEATGAAGLALGYAKDAGVSMGKAEGFWVLAAGEASAALEFSGDASDYADTSKAASKVAGERRDEAANSANSALTYYNNLKATGLNSLPNSGDVDFKGFGAINGKPGVEPNDYATVSQVQAASTGVQNVLGEPGQIVSSGGQNPVISISPQLGLNNLPNFADINAQGFAIINAAAGGADTDLATVGQVNSMGNSAVKSVTGTANQINVTAGKNPVISIANTAITPGFYRLANVTAGSDGRVTFASSTTVTGNEGRISVFNAPTNVNVDLDKTNITPGTYTLSNPTFDAYGRATAATSTSITGTAGKIAITGSGTTSMNVNLIDTGVVAGTYNFSAVTIGSDGRVSNAGSGSINGNTGRISVISFGSNASIDLSKTAVTAGTYNLINGTFDAYGRATGLHSTTISGSSGRIEVAGSGTTAMSINLSNITNAFTSTVGQYIQNDIYGRIIDRQESYYYNCTQANATPVTTTPTFGAWTRLNFPASRLISSANMTGSTLATNAGVTYAGSVAMKKTVSCTFSFRHNATTLEYANFALVKILNGVTTFYTYAPQSISPGVMYTVTLTGGMDLAPQEVIHVVTNFAENNRQISVYAANWTID